MTVAQRVIGGIVIALLWGSANADGQVIRIPAGDVELAQAIERARATLGEFWLAFDAKQPSDSLFSIQVKFEDSNGVEYLWINELQRRQGGTIIGRINNRPSIVKVVDSGDLVEVSEADVSDWVFMRSGKLVGCHTLERQFREMPGAEAAFLQDRMADQ